MNTGHVYTHTKKYSRGTKAMKQKITEEQLDRLEYLIELEERRPLREHEIIEVSRLWDLAFGV